MNALRKPQSLQEISSLHENCHFLKLPLPIVAFWFCIGTALHYFLFLPYHQHFLSRADLVVTANIAGGNSLDVFINGDFEHVFRQRIVPGSQARYVFQDVPGFISRLRIDPTDTPERDGIISKIELVVNGTTVSQIDPSSLSTWGMANLIQKPSSENSHEFRFLSTNNDPVIVKNDLQFGSTTGVEHESLFQVRRHLPEIVVILLLALVASSSVLEFLSPLALVFFLGTTVGTLLIFGQPLALKLTALSYPPLSIEHGVGYTSFFGLGKTGEKYAFFSSLLISGITGLILAGVSHTALNIFRKKSPAHISIEKTNSSTRFVATVLCLGAMLLLPPLKQIRDALPENFHRVSDYDSNNIFTWNYLYHYGFLPLKDYWFPYGGDYNQMGFLPPSQVASYFVNLVLFASFFWSIYELSGRRKALSVLSMFMLGFVIETGVFAATKRYLAAPSLLFCLLAFHVEEKRPPLLCAAIGLLFSWVFYREPTQLLYAGPGCLFIASFYGLRSLRSGSGRDFLTQYAFLGVSFSVGVAAFLLNLAHHGQLQGFFDFYRDFPGMLVSSALPAPITNWYRPEAQVENILFFGINILFGLSVFLFFRKSSREISIGLIAFSLLNILVFQKMLLRPHMAKQIVIYVPLALTLLFLYWSQRWHERQRAYGSILYGMAFLALLFHPDVNAAIHEHELTLRLLPENIHELLRGGKMTTEEKDDYYSFKRFVGIDGYQRQALDYLHEKGLSSFSTQLYILGDESYFYPALHLKPCPYITLYNTSTLLAQQQTIQCLRNLHPQYVLWNSAFQTFDGIPNTTRVPMLYDYVISKYFEETSFGSYHILRPRLDSEAFQWDYWSQNLGVTYELGEIPRLSSFFKNQTCDETQEKAAHCVDAAEVRSEGSIPESARGLRIQIGSSTFIIHYTSDPGSGPLLILLNRFWFWEQAQRDGITPRVTPLDNQAIVTLRKLTDSGAQLY